MSRISACLAAFICLFVVGARAVASPPPLVNEPLTAVPAHPYDESADAHADVAQAIARAAATHKYIMLDFGGNWCPDCRVTAGVLAMSGVRDWVDKNFVVVMIDAGRMNKNLDIAQTYDVRIKAVPTIVILDAQSHMLNAGNPTALSDARTMTPQAIVDTLSGWIGHPG
jgi:thiol-disulfide isomerase/thioredoxin